MPPTICVLLGAVAAGIGTTSVAAARFSVKGSIDIFQGIGNNGPWREPKSDFDNRLNTPNATGDFPIAGPNISAPYSASSTINGWSWSIAVAADLPITNASISAPKDGDEFYTGGKLTFNAPPSLLSSSSKNLSVNEDWQVCLFRWELNSAAYPNKLRTDDGTCSSILTSQCISDIEKAGRENCLCPISRKISSCAALGNDSALWDSTCGASFFNASDIRLWKDGKLETWVYGGAATHNQGNSTAYNYIGSLAWPVMASFGNGHQTTASMSCVRAKNAAEGSKAPTGEDFEEGGLALAGEGAEEEQDDQKDIGNRINGNWFALGVVFVSCMLIL